MPAVGCGGAPRSPGSSLQRTVWLEFTVPRRGTGQGPCFGHRDSYHVGADRSMSITAQQFELMKTRISRVKAARSSPLEPGRSTRATRHEIVLGVDPSLRGTGFGVVRLGRGTADLVTHGTIKSPSAWERSRCLLNISQALRTVVREHRPTLCIIEGLFYAQNFQTALIMGEARGASLVVAAEAGLEIYEVAPRKVKQAIVGYGAAQKSAVAKMVQRMLRLAEVPAADAADALALALTYAHENSRYQLTAPKRI